MVTSINKLRIELKGLIEALEGSVNRFYWKDLNRAMSENSDINYPLVCAYKSTAGLTVNQDRIQLVIDVADKVYQDYSNLNDVESDTLGLCRSIFNGMQSVRWKKIGRIESCTVRYFMFTNVDYVAGHSMTIDFNLRDLNGVCAEPFFDYDFDQVISGESPQVQVFNSDMSYDQIVECGGTLQLPDITYTVKNSIDTVLAGATVPSVNNIETTLADVDNIDSDGLTVPTPAGVAFTCTPQIVCSDATAVLKNTINNVISSTDIPSGDSQDIIAPDATATLNGNPFGSVPSGATADVELVDQTDTPIVPISVVGSKITVNTGAWWTRPSEWLPMPTITALDNRTVALYAVFENDFNAVAILLSSGNHTIDWGDGTNTSGSGASQTYNKVYNYSTVSGAVNVSDDGRNYKQVLVDIGYDSTTNTVNLARPTTPTTGTSLRTQNWLDISLATTFNGLTFITTAVPPSSGYAERHLERIKLQGLITTLEVSNAPKLKVFDYDFAQGLALTISNRMQYLGDFRRDELGTPISIDIASLISAFSFGLISEIGDLTVTSGFLSFVDCKNLQKVGNIDLTTSSSIAQMFTRNHALRKIGTITASASLTDISNFGQSNFSIGKIIFAGTLAGVTNTTQTFLDNRSLRRLILPNLTIGFDIRATQITGTNLQDLFTSLGTASGAQIITLPTFTTGEDTTIATGKGYTIAYA